MGNRGIGSTTIIVAVIVAVAAIAGGYYVLNSEMVGGEDKITENLMKLGLNENEINKILENVQNFRTSYTENIEERVRMQVGVDEEELRNAGFGEYYFINGAYFEVLFTLKWEKELSQGEPSGELEAKFQEKGISLPENAFIVSYRNEWAIYSQKEGMLFRLREKGDDLYVTRGRAPTISVSSLLDKYSSVKGADNRYESFYERTKKYFENYYDYDPEEKAREVLEGEESELGDESFVRYYENFTRLGAPGFGITFRERNIIGGVFVRGDISNITSKGVELAKVLENRLEEA